MCHSSTTYNMNAHTHLNKVCQLVRASVITKQEIIAIVYNVLKIELHRIPLFSKLSWPLVDII